MEDQYANEARIAHVLSGYKFVINRGSRDGVKVGQKYLVFSLGDSILDPESGNDLGVLEIVRGRAQVTHVQEQMSTLESTDVENLPGTIKRVKRNSTSGIWAFTGVPSEEVIEEGSSTSKVSINAEVGDLARPI
ncbi:MAG: hypothetical protein OXI81_16960 [Paracoccaceae bacterium]|nr:hypothetical protein [Paracoccaceae bacterium]